MLQHSMQADMPAIPRWHETKGHTTPHVSLTFPLQSISITVERSDSPSVTFSSPYLRMPGPMDGSPLPLVN